MHHNLPFEAFTEQGCLNNHKENVSHQASTNADRKSISVFTGEDTMEVPVSNYPAVVCIVPFRNQCECQANKLALKPLISPTPSRLGFSVIRIAGTRFPDFALYLITVSALKPSVGKTIVASKGTTTLGLLGRIWTF